MRLLGRTAVCLAAVTAALFAMGAGDAFGAQVKVCKLVTPGSIDSLGSKTFTFNVTTNYPGAYGPFTVRIQPNQCALAYNGWYALNLPVLTPSGTRTHVTVTEQILGSYVVQSISVAGALGIPHKTCWYDVIGRPTCNPAVDYDVYQAVGVTTFTNRYGFY
jgi:hypothetical protein